MRNETEIIDGCQVPQDEVPAFPRCNDPELQKWMYVTMKENNQRLQMALEARMEQLFITYGRAAGRNTSKSRPRPQAVVQQNAVKESDAKNQEDKKEELQDKCDDAQQAGLSATEIQIVRDMEVDAGKKEAVATPFRGRSTDEAVEKWYQKGWLKPFFTSRLDRDGFTREIGEDGQERIKLTGIDWFMRTPIDIVAGVLIFLSTLVVYLNLDYKGHIINHCDPTLLVSGGLAEVVCQGQGEPSGWPGAEEAFRGLEIIFCILFLLELAMRLWYFRCSFFFDKLNCLDGAVVLITTLDTFMFKNIENMEGMNISFIRIVRYAKLVRTLRFIRAMQLCHQLRVLIRTILSSFMSLFWSMLILCAFMLMSALFLCQTLQEFIMSAELDDGTREWVTKNYGTASKALWTMFEITFSGGWPNYVRVLLEEVNPWYAVFFTIYVGGVVFAVIRIITALFLKETLAVAANDAEMMIQQKMKDKEKFAHKLEEVFKTADESGDGLVSWEEFRGLVEDPKAKAHLSALELESHEVESLFDLLDDGDGNVSFDEFLKGVVRLKGGARSQDVLAILHDNRKVLNHVVGLENMLKRIVMELDTIYEKEIEDAEPLEPLAPIKSDRIQMADFGASPVHAYSPAATTLAVA